MIKHYVMKLVIEKDNDSFVIMVNDMLGRRRYNKMKFDTKENAMSFIEDEFHGDLDIKTEIID